KLAEGVYAGDTAGPQYVRARFAHEWEIGRVACKFQREVGFNRSVNFAGAAKINVPAPIGQLPSQDMLRATLLKFAIDLAQPMHIQHVIRAKRAIDIQLAAPVAVWLLLIQQIFLRPRNG